MFKNELIHIVFYYLF